MILTLTPNPSHDRTVALGGELERGAVIRVESVTSQAGGKGVNISRAAVAAGIPSVAVLPADPDDPFVHELLTAGIDCRPVPTTGAVRINLTISEPDGTTTKLNEPGAPLDADALDALTRAVLAHAETASWIVLSGSLPPGVPDAWYADVVARLASAPCHVAVDTSERPLDALAAAFGTAAPDLIKPNAEELAGLVGASPEELESAAAQGDPTPVILAANQLIERGAKTILVTLGAAGAVLVDPTGSWMAAPPPITPRSTVGAGDSSLAGYVRAAVGGAEPPRRLQMAVAYGSAAAALPGSALPAPSQVDLDAVRVYAITPAAVRP